MTALSRKLPESVEVAIVGAGIVGTAAAYALSKRGVRVALLEKGRVAGEQSSRNWGAVRQQRRDPAELPLMIECIRIWQGLERELEADLDWRQQGLMRIAYDRRTLAWGEEWLPVAREHGLDTRMLTPQAVGELLPHFDASACLGALYTASDGCAEPEKAAPAFAAAAYREGATVFERCAVTAIETKSGAVSGVNSEQGVIRADAVICAAGAWTSRLLRPLGHRHPSLWIRGTAARIEPIGLELRKLVAWGKSAYRQRPDGSLTLAAAEDGFHDLVLDSLRYGISFIPLALRNRHLLRFAVGGPLVRDLKGEFATFTTHRTLDPAPDLRGLERAKRAFAREYPGAPPLKVTRSWAGWIDYMPDELPVIDQLETPAGLFVAAGLHGNGFGMGPVVGKILADLVTRGTSDHDLRPFRATRF